MQKYHLFLCLLGYSALSAQPVAVMTDKMNQLYVGVPNQFDIVISDLPAERVQLTPSQGAIKRVDVNSPTYSWQINRFTTGKAWLVITDSLNLAAADTLFFRVKSLPEPVFKATENANGGVTGEFIGFCTEFLRPTVLYYDVTYAAKKNDPVTIHNVGARYISDIKAFFYRARPGDKIYIDNIHWMSGASPTIMRSDQVLLFNIKK